jgi:hypothetical protein
MAAGKDLPHDLSTFVIESALGIEHGFWGCVAAGATFRSLARRCTEPGRAVIREHRRELDAAEQRVNASYAAWRAGESTPADDALDDALRRWRELPRGGELVVHWNPAVRPRTRSGRG